MRGLEKWSICSFVNFLDIVALYKTKKDILYEKQLRYPKRFSIIAYQIHYHICYQKCREIYDWCNLFYNKNTVDDYCY
jgi:hypothetical protein